MKEVLAFIRVNKVEETKKALELNGFFSYSWRKCLGRGKELLSSAGQSLFLAAEGVDLNPQGIPSEHCRLIAKRFFSVIVPDDEVSRVVKIIIEANRTGNPGDGKIFVRRMDEMYSIHNGKAEP